MNLQILLNTIKNLTEEEVSIQEIQKGETFLTGICFGKGTLRPVVYVEQYEELFNEKGYLAVAEDIIATCKNAIKSNNMDISEITSWSYSKDHLVLCIAPANTNADSLAIPYLDLELYFRVDLDGKSYKVTQQILEKWNVTEKELLEISCTSNKYVVRSMKDTMLEILMEQGMPESMASEILTELETAPTEQHVITNSSQCFGASALYNKEIFKEIADKYESDLYICPSSIHELIVLPAKNIPVEDIDTMIREINQRDVSPEERLADHAYIFYRDTMEISW